MKTAVSLPDTLFKDAEKTAKSLGIPRSQLYALALEEFLKSHNKEIISETYSRLYSQTETEMPFVNEQVTIHQLRKLTYDDTW